MRELVGMVATYKCDNRNGCDVTCNNTIYFENIRRALILRNLTSFSFVLVTLHNNVLS